MTKIYAYAIGVLLLVIAIGGAWWYVHDLRADVTLAQAKQAEAEQSGSACAAALVQANDATTVAIAQAKAQHDQAQAVIDGAGKDKKANAAIAATFSQKVSTASKTSDCQSVLEATLCPALSGY